MTIEQLIQNLHEMAEHTAGAQRRPAVRKPKKSR